MSVKPFCPQDKGKKHCQVVDMPGHTRLGGQTPGQRIQSSSYEGWWYLSDMSSSVMPE